MRTVITILICLLGLGTAVFAQKASKKNVKKDKFSIIDAHVKSAPSNTGKSVLKLHQYISKKAKNNTEKVRGFYVWMADNIAYDVKAADKIDVSKLTTIENEVDEQKMVVNKVLKEKKAVCFGYAHLFQTLCEKSKIPSYVISGYSKGIGDREDKKINIPDHAWNVVFLKGKWRLLDPTWGSGFLNDKHKFEQKLNNDFFLASPNEFVLTHLPSDPMWQLMECPISLKTFQQDSSVIRQKVKTQQKCSTYHYQDSIRHFRRLSTPHQNLLSAKRAYAFNNKIKDRLGAAYFNYANHLAKQGNDETEKLAIDSLISLRKEVLKIRQESKPYIGHYDVYDEMLAYDYLNYGNALSRSIPVKPNKNSIHILRKVLTQYQTAEKLLRKSKSAQAKGNIASCKQNIEIAKKNIKLYEKHFK